MRDPFLEGDGRHARAKAAFVAAAQANAGSDLDDAFAAYFASLADEGVVLVEQWARFTPDVRP